MVGLLTCSRGEKLASSGREEIKLEGREEIDLERMRDIWIYIFQPATTQQKGKEAKSLTRQGGKG